MSCQHRDKFGNVRARRENVDFRGTSVYASPNAHNRQDQCPKDDVYSVLFVFLDLLYGKLIWTEYSRNRGNKELREVQSDKNMTAELKQLCLDDHDTFLDLTTEVVYESYTSLAHVSSSYASFASVDVNTIQGNGNEPVETTTTPTPSKSSLLSAWKASLEEQDFDAFTTRLKTQCRIILDYLKQLDFADLPDYSFLTSCFQNMLLDTTLIKLKDVEQVGYCKHGFNWNCTAAAARSASMSAAESSLILNPSELIPTTSTSTSTDGIPVTNIESDVVDSSSAVNDQRLLYDNLLLRDSSIVRLLNKSSTVQNIICAKGKYLGRQLYKLMSRPAVATATDTEPSSTVKTTAGQSLVHMSTSTPVPLVYPYDATNATNGGIDNNGDNRLSSSSQSSAVTASVNIDRDIDDLLLEVAAASHSMQQQQGNNEVSTDNSTSVNAIKHSVSSVSLNTNMNTNDPNNKSGRKRSRDSSVMAGGTLSSTKEEMVRSTSGRQQQQQQSADISYGVTWKDLVQELMSKLRVEQIRRDTVDLFESVLRDFNRFYTFQSSSGLTVSSNSNSSNNTHHFTPVIASVNDTDEGNNDNNNGVDMDTESDDEWRQFLEIQQVSVKDRHTDR